ncbi:phosphatidylinositol-4,5-bisphosphate 3-kinase catalytic subunit alpha isoform [Elysia marginata]|uniref:Phosphatidylinositol-4,5-bisphosphate 3-kinase catalytic subunit alpha isoform n=1 Tax=Elysia marginata TaxID=1093978 RepID=A0AAV4I3T0_9GAST|nr:phosphatidylinositol-4,5-bisphosphate 3-kinase catalytic subunit alpha isoform [Elysia marginata]
MPPSSGELWEHHLMPQHVEVDCLLPTGVLVTLPCARDDTLESIKKELWQKARRYPLFHKLMEPESYIFLAITQDAMREEFYDETRRLCDLRLFQPILKVMEPKGNRDEKMVNYEISMLIGVPVNEFNNNKDLEVITFRRNILKACKDVVDKRDQSGDHIRALYTYPPDIDSEVDLPQHLLDRLKAFSDESSVIICVWVVSDDNNRTKYTVKVPHMAVPSDVIAETIRRRSRFMNMSRENAERCIEEYRHMYVLKVCGCDQFLLAECPISQYRYIRECLAKESLPQLMLHTKENVYATLPETNFNWPSYMQRGIQALAEINKQQTTCIFDVDALLRVKIKCATSVNIKESSKIYIRACIYHGTEPMCEAKNTELVDSYNSRWDQWLDFLMVPDLPRSARLCLSICSESKRRNRRVHYALAWGNLQLFDFNKRHLHGSYMLHLWSMPQGMDDLLNPIGITGSNPNKDCPCLEIEFDKFVHPLAYPSDEQFKLLARQALLKEGTTSTEQPTEEELAMLEEITEKDPLSDISEQDKLLLWKLREQCFSRPKALPKLISAVKWNDRENVAQAIKYEPYYDNPITKFLLKRSLMSQKIGNVFFWHLKSEMHQTSIRQRFGLILEAYCRGCGPYLKNLARQVEALDKLGKLSEMLKHEVNADEHQKYLHMQLQQPDYREALQNLHSPLNTAHILGDINLEDCCVKTSKKLPLWLVWTNPDTMADMGDLHYRIMFKNGDDLRQDMLTLQVIGLMDTIWKNEGLDLRLIPYGCLSTGKDVGLIEVVKNAKTITAIQSRGGALSSIQIDSSQLHKWIREQNPDRYDHAIDVFKRSCAGYCVATFVLGIGDRHPENIMVTSEGQVFHIDFGHFLDHKKKKFGINRERVPFVLTEDFQRVIARGADKPSKHKGFKEFQELCGQAYLILRKHANLIITLFTMMLQCGIPELQSLDDIGYIRKTLAVEKVEERALEYFQNQFHSAYGDSWTTKVDWFFHNMKFKH